MQGFLRSLGLDIVINKVTQEEMQGVPHHLMSFHDPRDASYNVHLFRESALDLIDDIWQREKLPVIVGVGGIALCVDKFQIFRVPRIT